MPDVLGFRKRHRPASYTCGACNWDGAACRSSLRRHLASSCVVKPRARSRVAQEISSDDESLPDQLMPSNPCHSAEPDDLSSDPPLLSLGSGSPVGQDANGTSKNVPLRALEEQLLQQLQQAQLLDLLQSVCDKLGVQLNEEMVQPFLAAVQSAAAGSGLENVHQELEDQWECIREALRAGLDSALQQEDQEQHSPELDQLRSQLHQPLYDGAKLTVLEACFLRWTQIAPAPAAAAENNGATAPPGRACRAAAEPSGSGDDLLAYVCGEAAGSNMNPEVQQKRKKRSRSTPVAEMVSDDSDEQEYEAGDSEEESVEEAVAKAAQEAAARKSGRAATGSGTQR